MNEDTVLRSKAHEQLDVLLNALLIKHVPADEGIVEVEVSLVSCTGSSEEGTLLTHTFTYNTELCAYPENESWEVEASEAKHVAYDEDNKRVIEVWNSLGEL